MEYTLPNGTLIRIINIICSYNFLGVESIEPYCYICSETIPVENGVLINKTKKIVLIYFLLQRKGVTSVFYVFARKI